MELIADLSRWCFVFFGFVQSVQQGQLQYQFVLRGDLLGIFGYVSDLNRIELLNFMEARNLT